MSEAAASGTRQIDIHRQPGPIAPFCLREGLTWALDRQGAYAGGTDRETHEHLVAREGGEVIGIIKYRLHPVNIHLAHLLVAPRHRDSGVGSLLFDKFLSAVASEPRFREMVVSCEITSAEPDKVAHMLSKRGFRRSNQQWLYNL